MTSVRCAEVNWGREKLTCCGEEEILSKGKKWEREREWFKESNIHSHKKKTSQTTKWGVGGTD